MSRILLMHEKFDREYTGMWLSEEYEIYMKYQGLVLDRLVMNIELRMKFPGKSYAKIARKIDKIMYARLLKIQAQERELLSRI